METAIALIVGFATDTVFANGFHAEGVDWRDIGGSFYNSLGHDARGAARRAQPRPALRLTTGRIGGACCALKSRELAYTTRRRRPVLDPLSVVILQQFSSFSSD